MKQSHLHFANAYLQHGDKFRAYKEAYPNIEEGDSLRVAANRLFRQSHIQQYINEVEAPLRAEAMAQLQQAAQQRIADEVCTLQQKRLVLAQMILGHWQVRRHVKLKDTIVEVVDDLAPHAVLRAIELDCKLESGKYAAKDIKPVETQNVAPPPPEKPALPRYEPRGFENIPGDDPLWKGVTIVPSAAVTKETGLIKIVEGVPVYEDRPDIIPWNPPRNVPAKPETIGNNLPPALTG